MFTQHFSVLQFAIIIVASVFVGYYFGLIAKARSVVYSRLIAGNLLMVAGVSGWVAIMYVGMQTSQSVIALNIFATIFSLTVITGKNKDNSK